MTGDPAFRPKQLEELIPRCWPGKEVAPGVRGLIGRLIPPLSADISARVTPQIRNTLVRERAPLTNVTRDAGTLAARASALRASSVARPSTAAAATRTTSVSGASSISGRDRGRTRTVTDTPSPAWRR